MSTTVLKPDGRLRNHILSGLCGLLCVSVIQTSATADESDSLVKVQASERDMTERGPTDRGPTERGPTDSGSNERDQSRRNDLEDFSGPSLDGSDNNSLHPSRGSSGTPYLRLAPSAYADGISSMTEGPDLRYLSNRIFADRAQNFFSQNGVSQWAYNWGQFVDHTIALRVGGEEVVEVPFDDSDPLEFFSHSDGAFNMVRSAAAPGTGESTPREQLNSVSSYIDAWAVYGGTEERLEWLREGPVDGDLSNNGARLLLTDNGNLPTASARGDASTAPVMERAGQLLHIPDADEQIIIAGDKRANENIALTTVQTLFAREHNRIVDELPDSLPEQTKFDIARRLVIATQQYITYNEFLPALGLHLEPALRYRSEVDVTVSTEFASVGYRAHSMIHGEIEMSVPVDRFSEEELAAFIQKGIGIDVSDEEVELAVPLNVAFANPQLAASLGIGAIAAGLGSEPQYKNDEQIDNQLRSILFQLPDEAVQDTSECLDGPTLHECFMLANDVGSIDVFRARDHGIARYNELRETYGLSRISSFAELTGELSEDFSLDDTLVDTTDPINDPDILDYVELRDVNGQLLELGSEAADTQAVSGVRRTTLAARLKAIYSDVDNVDGFVGMISESHLPGSDLGPLQHAMWKQQFEALRDGDSDFYLWNEPLSQIIRSFGSDQITYRQSLSDVIINNTELEPGDIQAEIFLSAE